MLYSVAHATPQSMHARHTVSCYLMHVDVSGCQCHDIVMYIGDMDRQYAVSAALLDDVDKTAWLLDCTPDFREQYDLVSWQMKLHKP